MIFFSVILHGRNSAAPKNIQSAFLHDTVSDVVLLCVMLMKACLIDDNLH